VSAGVMTMIVLRAEKNFQTPLGFGKAPTHYLAAR
jgi:hypothetical protein